MTYKFHKDFLGYVMLHVVTYDFIVLSLAISDNYYTVELSDTITSENFIHLQENYGLEIV